MEAFGAPAAPSSPHVKRRPRTMNHCGLPPSSSIQRIRVTLAEEGAWLSRITHSSSHIPVPLTDHFIRPTSSYCCMNPNIFCELERTVSNPNPTFHDFRIGPRRPIRSTLRSLRTTAAPPPAPPSGTPASRAATACRPTAGARRAASSSSGRPRPPTTAPTTAALRTRHDQHNTNNLMPNKLHLSGLFLS